MEVIALQGHSNSGKSETINIVYQLLLQNGYTQVRGQFIGPLGNPAMRDFLDVLQKDDKIVYVEIVNAPKRTIGLVWRKSLTRVELVKEIGKIAKE